MTQPTRVMHMLATSGLRAFVIFSTVTAIVVGGAVATIPVSYRANAIVAAQQASSDASVAKVFGLSEAAVNASEQRLPYVLTGRAGREAIAARVSSQLRGVTPTQIENDVSIHDTTDPSTPVGRQYTRAGLHVLAVTAVSNSRQKATAIADRFAIAYVGYRKASVIALQKARSSELASRLRATQPTPGARTRLQGLRDQLTQLNQFAAIEENSLEFRVRAGLPQRRVGPYVLRDALVAGLLAALMLLLLRTLADAPEAARRAVSAQSLGSSS